MNDVATQIKEKIDIVSFIGQYISLKKAGNNYKAPCPFHQEKTPSFVVSPERGIWHCFGSCNTGGDVITFLMKWDNINFQEALSELAKQYKIEIPQFSVSDSTEHIKNKLIQLHDLAVRFYQYVLHELKTGKDAREYLVKRGINEGIQKKFEIGYAPSSWDSFVVFAKKKGFSNDELIQSGLAIRTRRNTLIDRFGGRIMFPIKNIRGNTVAFSGRILQTQNKEAKYINSPETLIYHKRETLFGLHLAKEAIKKTKRVLLVEGEFDVISPYQKGVENVVAVKGSAVTREQMTILSRFADEFYIALDSDEAGSEAAKRTIEEAMGLGIDLYVVRFEQVKDPDEAAQKNISMFKEALKHPIPVYDFILEFFAKKYPPTDIYGKKKYGEAVSAFLKRVQNPIIQSHYVKKVASILQVDDKSIWKTLRSKQIVPMHHSEQLTSRDELLQRYLLGALLHSNTPKRMLDTVRSLIQVEDFTYPAIRKLYEQLIDYLDQKQQDSFSISSFTMNLQPELRVIADNLYLFISTSNDLTHLNITQLAQEIKKFSIKKQIQQYSGDKNQNEQKLVQLNSTLNELEKR